ncbi:hypothetical protein IAR55_006005 [Kwoniella newhampshirensis]|uniref:Extracellular membrane protein CFEM domain-containing protein n=1 Tax=Kwoniella newhampshirensis TaxID=1651941 RepID=A0AAW0YUE7_9TREE
MLTVALVSVLGALSAAAQITPRHMSLLPRQLDASSIPSGCTSTCSGILTIYQSCSASNTAQCVQICQQSNFNSLIDCIDCIFASPGVDITGSEQTQLDSAISQLQSACSSAGSAVTGSLNISAAGATASGSATASDAGLVSSVVDFTTALSGTTIAAGGSSVTSAAFSTTTPSTTAAASSAAATSAAATSAAAASASAAAGSAAPSSAPASAASPVLNQGLMGGVIAVVGVVGGAMMML